ncbi:slit homolog 1 protein-like [Stegodyphus dumicola]|uniref:slit homolog 1 protein-like n=1 Tax=Stegodyphus dumicola TaxID=202533 RepID=UPI0015A93038|nr:slit homolog 1 protein-like [Stegodyphus dumicola]XP_035213393.1 slit homolog 1 protein-like [Stegodyphus dumicola]
MKIFISVLWISLCLIVTPSSFACPKPDDIAPCTCFKATIYCQEPNITLPYLERIMKNVSAGFYQRILLKNLKLGNLSLEIFENVDVNMLEIIECELSGIISSNRVLPVFGDTLREIHVYRSINDTKGDFTLDLKSVPRLHTLVLYYSSIPLLRSVWFPKSLNSVTHLRIYKSGIEQFENKVFQNLINLEELDLSSNKLQNISRSLLPKPANSLKTLDFSDNIITDVPEDFFSEMMSLETVSFHNNRIRILPEIIWGSVWSQLKELRLDGNPLACGSEIEWMFNAKRPSRLFGSCAEPPERKYQYMQYIIDEHNRRKDLK